MKGGNVLNWSGMPTAISLFTFCYASHTIFPTLYTSMRDRYIYERMPRLTFKQHNTPVNVEFIFSYMVYGYRFY